MSGYRDEIEQKLNDLRSQYKSDEKEWHALVILFAARCAWRALPLSAEYAPFFETSEQQSLRVLDIELAITSAMLNARLIASKDKLEAGLARKVSNKL